MPGLLMTTSQASRAANPPAAVARTSLPPDDWARLAGPSAGGEAGWSSTSAGSMPIDWRRCRLAVPSTPSPQMPTLALVSADQEVRGRIALRYVVLAEGREEMGHRVIRQSGLVAEAFGQRLQHRRVFAIGCGRRVLEFSAALAGVTPAPERLVVAIDPKQVVETVLQAGVLQRLAPVEDSA